MLALGTPTAPDATTEWLQIIRAEYLEMPALALTRQQMQRLFGLDVDMCNILLRELLISGFLVRRPDGNYARPHDDV